MRRPLKQARNEADFAPDWQPGAAMNHSRFRVHGLSRREVRSAQSELLQTSNPQLTRSAAFCECPLLRQSHHPQKGEEGPGRRAPVWMARAFLAALTLLALQNAFRLV